MALIHVDCGKHCILCFIYSTVSGVHLATHRLEDIIGDHNQTSYCFYTYVHICPKLMVKWRREVCESGSCTFRKISSAALQCYFTRIL